MDLYVGYCLGPICNLPSWFQAAYQVCLGACQWAELISEHLSFNTSLNGSHERPPAELNQIVELCECDVWSELTGVWKS